MITVIIIGRLILSYDHCLSLPADCLISLRAWREKKREKGGFKLFWSDDPWHQSGSYLPTRTTQTNRPSIKSHQSIAESDWVCLKTAREVQDRSLYSNLSHSLKPYDQSMRGKLHANQPKKSSKTSQNHQRLRNNGSDDCRLIQSADTAHLQLFQSKPHSLAFCLGKMMLCGWWSPKACQDNGSNASAVPLNYCVCVSQRHYLT